MSGFSLDLAVWSAVLQTLKVLESHYIGLIGTFCISAAIGFYLCVVLFVYPWD